MPDRASSAKTLVPQRSLCIGNSSPEWNTRVSIKRHGQPEKGKSIGWLPFCAFPRWPIEVQARVDLERVQSPTMHQKVAYDQHSIPLDALGAYAPGGTVSD